MRSCRVALRYAFRRTFAAACRTHAQLAPSAPTTNFSKARPRRRRTQRRAAGTRAKIHADCRRRRFLSLVLAHRFERRAVRGWRLPRKSFSLRRERQSPPRFLNPPIFPPKPSPSINKGNLTSAPRPTARSTASPAPARNRSSSIPKRNTSGISPFGPDGTLYVATGDKGQIFAVIPPGNANSSTPATKPTSACWLSTRKAICSPAPSRAAASCASLKTLAKIPRAKISRTKQLRRGRLRPLRNPQARSHRMAVAPDGTIYVSRHRRKTAQPMLPHRRPYLPRRKATPPLRQRPGSGDGHRNLLSLRFPRCCPAVSTTSRQWRP